MMLGLHKVVFVKFLSGDNGTEGGAKVGAKVGAKRGAKVGAKRGAGSGPIVDGDG